MIIRDYDCGDLSEVVLSGNYPIESAVEYIVVTTGGVSSILTLSYNNPSVDFFCSGALIIQSQTFMSVLISPIPLQNVWSENFLMGLAGIVCAFFLSYVFVKYAV